MHYYLLAKGQRIKGKGEKIAFKVRGRVRKKYFYTTVEDGLKK